METDSTPSPLDALTALDHVRSGRQAAARRVTTPWWYHPLVGLALAVLVGSGSLDGPARAAVLVGSLVLLGLLFALYRRLTGLWVNAYNVPGTRRATTAAVLTTLAVLLVANALEHALDLRGALVVGGVVLGVAYTVFWRWVERRLAHLWQTSL